MSLMFLQGYGDVTPHSKIGKLFGAFLVTFGLITFTLRIRAGSYNSGPATRSAPRRSAAPRVCYCSLRLSPSLAYCSPASSHSSTARAIFVWKVLAELNDIAQAEKLGAEKTLLQRLEELSEVIDADDDGIVSEPEYILFNLKKMGKVDSDTLALLRDQFKVRRRHRSLTHTLHLTVPASTLGPHPLPPSQSLHCSAYALHAQSHHNLAGT